MALLLVIELPVPLTVTWAASGHVAAAIRTTAAFNGDDFMDVGFGVRNSGFSGRVRKHWTGSSSKNYTFNLMGFVDLVKQGRALCKRSRRPVKLDDERGKGDPSS